MSVNKLSDEQGRQAALDRYQVLDTPPEQPFDKITSLVRTVLQVPLCAVSLIDRERQWFKSINGLDAAETPRSAAFCTHTIKTYQPMVIPDALDDDRFKSNPLVVGSPLIRSYAGAPLATPEGYNVGALCAIDFVPREFTGEQLGILNSFASLVVDELELRRVAERDHLTGALSRRGLVAQMDKELKRFARRQRESVLIIMDVDRFKFVNDTFGHPAGDQVLQAIAATCAAQLRAEDSFGRWGGEEFAILLADSDGRAGWAVAEKIRRSIETMLVPVAGGIAVTASFGLAVLDPETADVHQWVAAADEALYRAKRTGRNRCEFAHRTARIAAA